jgi:hypothetical protein
MKRYQDKNVVIIGGTSGMGDRRLGTKVGDIRDVSQLRQNMQTGERMGCSRCSPFSR